MATHTSATAQEESPHVLETSRTNTIIDALKRRALAVLNDESLDAQSRTIIRYGLETHDPWLAELVRRADAGEPVIDAVEFSQPLETSEQLLSQYASHENASAENGSGKNNSSENASAENARNTEKIQALAEIICGAGNESAAALFVLMGAFENSAHPKVLANTVKHFAFTRCGELNVYGMVDAQIPVVEGELLAHNRFMA